MAKQEVSAESTMFSSVVAKVKAFLKIDDDGKIEKMIATQIRFYEAQIGAAKDAIKTNELKHEANVRDNAEKLEELLQEEEEAFLNLDLDRVLTNESRKAYTPVLDAQFDRAINARKKHEEVTAKEVEEFEKTQSALEAKIELLQYKIDKYKK